MNWPELVPNLHPFLAYAGVALLFAASLFLLVGTLAAARAWTGLIDAGRWNLYAAALTMLGSVCGGVMAWGEVHVVPGEAMIPLLLHRRWAVVACWLVVFAAVGAWRVRQRAPGWIVLTLLLAGSVAATLSALYGAQLVYRHGIGIERRREEPRMPVAQVGKATVVFTASTADPLPHQDLP